MWQNLAVFIFFCYVFIVIGKVFKMWQNLAVFIFFCYVFIVIGKVFGCVWTMSNNITSTKRTGNCTGLMMERKRLLLMYVAMYMSCHSSMVSQMIVVDFLFNSSFPLSLFYFACMSSLQILHFEHLYPQYNVTVSFVILTLMCNSDYKDHHKYNVYI